MSQKNASQITVTHNAHPAKRLLQARLYIVTYDQQGNISPEREDELKISAAAIESGTSGVSDVPELFDAGKSDAGKIAGLMQ